MADIGQWLLQNDIFVSLGITLFASLPAITPYWLPVIHPNSAPEQFQFSSGAAIASTVTRTATIFPKPKTLTDKVYQTILKTQTETRTTTTTATVSKTVYDTVTERLTSVSTYTDRHYLTKWTHLSVDPPTPCTTVVHAPTAMTQSLTTPASKAYPLNASQSPITTHETTSWVPWRFIAYTLLIVLALSLLANLIMYFWDLRVVILSGDIKALQERYDMVMRNRQGLKEKFQTDRADLIERCQDAERVAVMVQAKDIMLQKLGVHMPGDEAGNNELDPETLANMVQARMNVLANQKHRLDHLETKNKAQAAKIQDLENTIATRLNSNYLPGVSRSFDELLRSKQQEINNLRGMLNNSNAPDHVIENDELHQKKDAELIELRPLRKEVEELQKALTESKNETAVAVEQKKAKGVADERRWNEERSKLNKAHSDKMTVLKEKHDGKVAALESEVQRIGESVNTQKTDVAKPKAQSDKAKRSAASSSTSQHVQSADSQEVDGLRNQIANLEIELQKTKQLSAASEKARQSQSEIEALKLRTNDSNSKQNASTETVSPRQQDLDEADGKYKALQQNFMILVKQYEELAKQKQEPTEQHRRDLDEADQRYKGLQQNFMTLVKQHQELAKQHQESTNQHRRELDEADQKYSVLQQNFMALTKQYQELAKKH